MNRRTLLSTIAGFFVGKKVVASADHWPSGRPIAWGPLTLAQKQARLDQYYAALMQAYSGPVGPVGMPGPRGPSVDGQTETEAEHAQRWADAEEWNRRWYERGSI